jgi:hypothetical protein
MIKIDKQWIKLASMGSTLDNARNQGDPIIYIPNNGDIYYDPNEKLLKEIEEGSVNRQCSPNKDKIYFNALSQIAYTWDGDKMNEIDKTGNHVVYENNTSFQTKSIFHISSFYPEGTSPLSQDGNKTNLTIPDDSILVFHGDGCFVNCNIKGKNLQVITNGKNTRFLHCVFAEATFRDSSLYATNFGAIGNMTSVSSSLTLGSLNAIPINIRTGQNNEKNFSSIANFLSGSNHIKLEFNGDFLSEKYEYEIIKDANDLEIYGGTITSGFKLQDCCNIFIHDVNFVGHHEIHDFPKMQSHLKNPNNQLFDTEGRMDMIQHYFIGNEETSGIRQCGLTGPAISATRTKNCIHFVGNIRIERCHFEMREHGVAASSYYDDCPENYRPFSNLRVNNCTFSHIFYQPVGSHCENSIFENIKSEYCLQGIDFSRCANNSIVRNSEFRDCAVGPKQENNKHCQQFSYNNRIEDCYYEINDNFDINATRFIFYANAGIPNDIFKVIGCRFVVNSTSQEFYRLISCRSHYTLIENCSMDICIQSINNNSDYDAQTLFCVGGLTPHQPILILNNTHIKCNAKLSYIYAPYNTKQLNLIIKNSHIDCNEYSFNLTGTFSSAQSVLIENSFLNIVTANMFNNTPDITVSKSYLKENVNNLVNPVTTGQRLTIEFSTFDYVGTFLKLTSAGDTINLNNNKIKCNVFADCYSTSSLSNIIVDSNKIEIVGAPNDSLTVFHRLGTNSLSNLTPDNFIIQNNYFYASDGLSVMPLPTNSHSSFAHLLYDNIFSGTSFTTVSVGDASLKPTTPEQGMVYFATDGTRYIYTSDGWMMLSFPDILLGNQ